MFKNLRRDYTKAVKSRAALSDRLSRAVKENEHLAERLRGAKENQGKLQAENSTLAKVSAWDSRSEGCGSVGACFGVRAATPMRDDARQGLTLFAFLWQSDMPVTCAST